MITNIHFTSRTLGLGFFAFALATGAIAQSTFTSADARFAWDANCGWIDFRGARPGPGDGVRVTSTHLSGYGWSANTGWINFGDGSPLDAIRYSNTTGIDCGVNHDGAGNLSGLAWSANLGWINFSWAVAGDTNRPRFDISSGSFSGYAWGANAGWINLGTGMLRTDSIDVIDSDADGNGMAGLDLRLQQGRDFGLVRLESIRRQTEAMTIQIQSPESSVLAFASSIPNLEPSAFQRESRASRRNAAPEKVSACIRTQSPSVETGATQTTDGGRENA